MNRLRKLLKRDQRRFILSVGDEGGILTLMEKRRMVKRLFATTPNAPDFRELISSMPDAPVYILVDVVDQAYIQQTLPPVSMFNIRKLVQRKLSKDFDAKDIKAAIPLSKGKSGQKELSYLFLSVRHVPPFTEWIGVIAELPNRFAGIYLLPIEAIQYLQDIKSGLSETRSQKIEWEILVTHNKVGGFRQIVFRNGKTIFTRIAQPIGGQTPDVVAGNIEQETLNTIEYIRRLGFADEHGLAIYIIASPDVKKVLEMAPLPCNMLRVLTPYEVGSLLKLDNAAEEKDRFGDVIAAAHFANKSRRTLRLSTPYLNSITLLANAMIGARAAAAVVFLLLLAMSVRNTMQYFELSEKVELAQVGRANEEEKLKKIENRQLPFDRPPQEIREVAQFDMLLTKDNSLPFDFIAQYGRIKGFNMFVSGLNMDVMESGKDNAPTALDSKLTVEFVNGGRENLDQLLDDINRFTTTVIKEFNNYQVSFAGLPEETDIKLDLGTGSSSETKNFSFELNIKGPENPTEKNKS